MKNLLLLLLTILILAGCKQNNKQEIEQVNYEKTREFANLWFHYSAEMEACYLQTYKWAGMMMEKQLSTFPKEAKKPAVVLDLDETVLDNSPYQFKLIETASSYTFENWDEW
ncbi:MAG: HAD family acid phosphatase, partial [Bacteroidales bacterium]|nr:HAD family acid phosphatase [Bacteroidales bacterium]